MSRRRPIDERRTFALERGYLVRTVTKRDGSTYSHRCSLESYKAVAYFVEEHTAEGVTTGMLWEGLPDVACTQASVALEFLKDRGCVTTTGRRSYPASDILYEDAMIEFHTLAARPGTQ
jgi:hypothetical protein